MSVTEGDSVLVEVFESSSNFTVKVDSVISRVEIGTEGEMVPFFGIYLPERLQTTHDYRITLLRYADIYTLTNFEIEKQSCNTCFPTHPKGDFYNVLKSYAVNGQKVNKDVLEITK